MAPVAFSSSPGWNEAPSGRRFNFRLISGAPDEYKDEGSHSQDFSMSQDDSVQIFHRVEK